MKDYQCPICRVGVLTILVERTGPTGYRETEYKLINKTCDCISYVCESVLMGVISFSPENGYLICDDCGGEDPTIHYPIRSWVGEYKEICSKCFEKEIDILKKQYEGKC